MIAEDSPHVATTFIQKLEANFQPLLDYPELGPKRDYLSPGLRAHFYRGYAIYYEVTEKEIIIVRVTHGAKDQATLFDVE